jgi:hypothetical protein
MVKVEINGKVYSFDNEHYPMSEAVALEEGIGIDFGEWESSALARGSARAMAGFVWLVLKRDGQNVPLADILSGKFPLITSEIRVKQEAGDDAPGPTNPGSAPDGTTGSDASASSTTSPRRSSTRSTSPTSTGSSAT